VLLEICFEYCGKLKELPNTHCQLDEDFETLLDVFETPVSYHDSSLAASCATFSGINDNNIIQPDNKTNVIIQPDNNTKC
jgi:hypothetical protein